MNHIRLPHSEIPGLKCLFAAIRGLSQLTTSFIACQCQGIHYVPLLSCIALNPFSLEAHEARPEICFKDLNFERLAKEQAKRAQ